MKLISSEKCDIMKNLLCYWLSKTISIRKIDMYYLSLIFYTNFGKLKLKNSLS